MPPFQEFIPGNQSWDKKGSKNGPKEILYDGYYYDVTDFIKRHPGGEQIIGYFTVAGEDATLPIQQFHNRSIRKVLGIMKSFKRRPATEVAEVFDEKTRAKNKVLTEDFTKLFLELKAEGLFEPSYFHIVPRILEMVTLGAIGFYLITQMTSITANSLGCIIFALAQTRVLGVMHDSGHLSLTGNPKMDRVIQSVSLGGLMGISAKYWREFHSFHHAQTCRVKHDLDFETLPFVAVNLNVLDDPKKDQNIMLRHPIIFAPFFVISSVFYLQFVETIKNQLKYKFVSEMLGLVIYYLIAYQIGLLPMVVATFLTSTWFGVNSQLNHSHLPMTTKPTHWVEQALFHTVDVEHRFWCDWWMVLLNYQIEHHLFPTMPQFKNRLAVGRVRAFAEKHGLPYRVLSYREAFVKMITNIWDISDELRKIHKE